MKTVEYGKGNEDVMIFLHGGGLSWWNYKEVAEILAGRFHIVIPILDGHSGSDTPFTSIEDNAKEIVSYIDEKFDGRVLLIGGLSLGGQILTEILSLRSDICKYAIIESALTKPMKLTNILTAPMLHMSYPLIKQKWFAKLQFAYLRIKKELFDEYYMDTCAIKKSDMISFLKANTSYSLKEEIKNTDARVYIFAGSKEQKVMIKSAEMLRKTIPGSTMKILDGMYHGQFSIDNPQEYARMIIGISQNDGE